RGAVPPSTVALQQVRHVARHRRRVLLLVGRPRRVLFSRRGLAVATHRLGEHNGVHAYPIEYLPDRGGRGAEPRGRPGAAAGARGAVADGCADTLLLRDGGRDATRTFGGGKRHLRATQPCRRGQPGDGRRAVRGRLRGLAVRDLWRPQDPLRLRPALGLPPHQAARGTVRPPRPTCSRPWTLGTSPRVEPQQCVLDPTFLRRKA